MESELASLVKKWKLLPHQLSQVRIIRSFLSYGFAGHAVSFTF